MRVSEASDEALPVNVIDRRLYWLVLSSVDDYDSFARLGSVDVAGCLYFEGSGDE